jgi:MFS transporter, AAHS family, 4-hydroxybenzoate transporter
MAATVDVGALIDANPMGGVQRTVVVLCGLIALLDGFDLQSIGLAAPIIAQTLHIPPQTLGAVFSAALAGLALGAFGLGPVADRFGRKKVLIAATLCFGVFTVCTALATTLNELIAYRFLTGLGLGGAMPSFIALTAEYAPRHQRATVVAILWGGFPLGGVIGGLLGSQLIPTVGWQSLFYVGGFLPIVLVPLLALFLPESLNFMVRTGAAPDRVTRLLRRMFPATAIPDDARFVLTEGEGRGVPVRELFSPERGFGTAMLWVSFFVTFMLLVTNTAWSPILLKAEGMEVARSAVAMAVFNFGSVIGSSAAGWLITRFGAVSVLPVSFVVAAASLIAVGQGAPSPGLVTAAQGMLGLSLGCGSSGLIVLAALFYPTQIRSTGVGWSMGMGRFGSFVGPLVVGALVAAKLPITTVFLLIGLACLIPVIPCALTGAGRRARTVQV